MQINEILKVKWKTRTAFQNNHIDAGFKECKVTTDALVIHQAAWGRWGPVIKQFA